MADLSWLTDAQMAWLEPYFPKSQGKPRVDDRRVLSGITFVNRNGLRCRDAPTAYGPHKTLCSGGAIRAPSRRLWLVWRPRAAKKGR